MNFRSVAKCMMVALSIVCGVVAVQAFVGGEVEYAAICLVPGGVLATIAFLLAKKNQKGDAEKYTATAAIICFLFAFGIVFSAMANGNFTNVRVNLFVAWFAGGCVFAFIAFKFGKTDKGGDE